MRRCLVVMLVSFMLFSFDAIAEVAPEIVAYRGLHAASMEQTRNLESSITNQNYSTKIMQNGRIYENYYQNSPTVDLWVNPAYFSSTTEAPFSLDSEVMSLEAGLGIQENLNHKIGLFGSYRQGEHDFDGSGDEYFANLGANIDITGYSGGLYYRYDRNNWYGLVTVYGGTQEAEITTDGNADITNTEAIEIGGGGRLGKTIPLLYDFALEPSLGIFYTQTTFDDINDGAGRTVEYDTMGMLEFEGNLRLEKTFIHDNGLISKIYLKSAVIQPMVHGASVNITGLGDIETYEEDILWRGEVGGKFNLTPQLSAYGKVVYTAGSNYDATTFGIGLNYAFGSYSRGRQRSVRMRQRTPAMSRHAPIDNTQNVYRQRRVTFPKHRPTDNTRSNTVVSTTQGWQGY